MPLNLLDVRPRSSPEIYCTLRVASWHGPSQLISEEFGLWAAKEGLGFSTCDTMVPGGGTAVLAAPGTVACVSPVSGKRFDFAVAPFAEFSSALYTAFAGELAATPTAPPRYMLDHDKNSSSEPAARWQQAIFENDADIVRRRWRRMDAHDRVAACCLAAAIGANAVLDAVLDESPALAASADNEPAGNTPLHYAALSNNLVGVKILLGRGAPLSAPNPVNTEPCHDAARAASAPVLQLLAGGPSFDAVNRYGDNVLHRLAMYGGDKEPSSLEACYQVVKETFLKPRKEASWAFFIKATNVDGFTPLDLAAAFTEDKLCRLLIDDGAQHGARWRARGGMGYAGDEVLHTPYSMGSSPSRHTGGGSGTTETPCVTASR